MIYTGYNIGMNRRNDSNLNFLKITLNRTCSIYSVIIIIPLSLFVNKKQTENENLKMLNH